MVLCKSEFKDVLNKGCPLVLGGPLPHVIAAKAVAFKEANEPAFQSYARQVVVNAKALAEALMQQGTELVTAGTDNHLILINVASSFGLTGRQAELALREAGLTVNRNSIPWDTNGAWYTSGVRIGTPAMTTLGMKEKEMQQIAKLMVDLLKATKPLKEAGAVSRAGFEIEPSVVASVKERGSELLKAFPLYPELVIE